MRSDGGWVDPAETRRASLETIGPDPDNAGVGTIAWLLVQARHPGACTYFFGEREEPNVKTNTRRLTETAILIAMGTVLSLFKIDLPFGGGVTICSMLPLVIISYRYGWKWGGFAGFVYSLLQLMLGLDNVRYASTAIMAAGVVVLDYILAYTVIGFASFFGGKPTNTLKSLVLGIVVSFVLRLVCHYITGVWIWGEWMPEEFMGMAMTSPWLYSFLYNGWYMLAEIVVTVIVAIAIYNPLKKYINGEDLK